MSGSGVESEASSTCHLCGLAGRRRFSRGGVTWWRCRRCGLFFAHPQPGQERLDELYMSAYYEASAEYGDKDMARWEARVASLERLTAPTRILDVGCGQGMFLLNALARGWDAWGLEVSTAAITGLPEPARSRALVGKLATAPFREGTFDALSLFDVIEHVRAPVRFLEECGRLLRPGGLLVITTPDVGSLKAKIKRRFWRYFDFERYLHLFHFDAESLQLALSKAGFEVSHWFRKRGTPLYVAARRM